MKRAAAILIFVAFCSVVVALAQAQEQELPSQLEPAVDTSADAASAPADEKSSATNAPTAIEPRVRPGSRALDRIELDTTEITGNRELPKVLYIVPWKRSDLGDLAGKPINSLLDEVLAPVDRDVFKRENRYYRALQPDGSPSSGASQAPPADVRTDSTPDSNSPARDER